MDFGAGRQRYSVPKLVSGVLCVNLVMDRIVSRHALAPIHAGIDLSLPKASRSRF